MKLDAFIEALFELRDRYEAEGASDAEVQFKVDKGVNRTVNSARFTTSGDKPWIILENL